MAKASFGIMEHAPVFSDTVRDWVKLHGSPLLILDCDQVRTQYRRLSRALSGVDIHYAMKALPLPAVITTLAAEGCSFDVASTGEIGVLQALHVLPERTIHTHPIKRDQDIRDALAFGCSTFVVDNAAELAKFIPYRSVASLILRVGFRSDDAVVDLAKKFGCAPSEALSLLQRAYNFGVRVEGISFHVGSQCNSSRSHVAAIEACALLIVAAAQAGITPLRLLDIGGGFPVPYLTEVPDIETFCAPIQVALKQLPRDVRVVAEPGRYLVGPAVQAVATVIGKATRAGVPWYYLDDGVFGSYSGQIYDGAHYPLSVIAREPAEARASVLAGPTCDSIDIVAENIMLPELGIGDLVVARTMGAYTTASASDFNMVPRAKLLVLDRHAVADSCRPTASAPRAAIETGEHL